MTESLKQVAEQIASGTAGQIIDKAGYTAIGTGAGVKIMESSHMTQSYFETLIPHTIADWAGIFSILGVLSFMAKNIFSMWLDNRREKRESGRINSK